MATKPTTILRFISVVLMVPTLCHAAVAIPTITSVPETSTPAGGLVKFGAVVTGGAPGTVTLVIDGDTRLELSKIGARPSDNAPIYGIQKEILVPGTRTWWVEATANKAKSGKRSLEVAKLSATTSVAYPTLEAGQTQTFTVVWSSPIPDSKNVRCYLAHDNGSGGILEIDLARQSGSIYGIDKAIQSPGKRSFKALVKTLDTGAVMGESGSMTYVVVPLAVPKISGPALVTCTVGQPLKIPVDYSGKVDSWSLSGNPVWLSITKEGWLVGTPQPPVAPYALTVSATNKSGTGSGTVKLRVNPALVVIPEWVTPAGGSATIEGTINTPIEYRLLAKAATGSISYTTTTAGASIADDLLRYTPSEAGTVQINLTATHSTGGKANAALTIKTSAPPPPEPPKPTLDALETDKPIVKAGGSTTTLTVRGENLDNTVEVTVSQGVVTPLNSSQTAKTYLWTLPKTPGTYSATAMVDNTTKTVDVEVAAPTTIRAKMLEGGVIDSLQIISKLGDSGQGPYQLALGSHVLWEADAIPPDGFTLPGALVGDLFGPAALSLRDGKAVELSRLELEPVAWEESDVPVGTTIVVQKAAIGMALAEYYGNSLKPTLAIPGLESFAAAEVPTGLSRSAAAVFAAETAGSRTINIWKGAEAGLADLLGEGVSRIHLSLPVSSISEARDVQQAILREYVTALKAKGVPIEFREGLWRLRGSVSPAVAKQTFAEVMVALDTNPTVIAGRTSSILKGNIHAVLASARSSVRLEGYDDTLAKVLRERGLDGNQAIKRLAEKTTQAQTEIKAVVAKIRSKALAAAGVSKEAGSLEGAVKVVSKEGSMYRITKNISKTKGKVRAIIFGAALLSVGVAEAADSTLVFGPDGVVEVIPGFPVKREALKLVKRELGTALKESAPEIFAEVMISPLILVDALAWWGDTTLGNRRDEPVGILLWHWSHGARDAVTSSIAETVKPIMHYYTEDDFCPAPSHWSPPPADPVTAFVGRLYQQVMARDPDAGGLALWTSALRGRHMSPAELVSAFFSSQEWGTGLNVEDEVVRRYQACFGRVPSTAEIDGWIALYVTGQRGQSLTDGFVFSAEFKALCEGFGLAPTDETDRRMFAIRNHVRNAYQEGLGRYADEGGLKSWTEALSTGAATGLDLGLAVLTGPEATARKLDNLSWLNAAYRVALGRSPSSGEAGGWSARLATGLARAIIAKDILISPESMRRMNQVGIVPAPRNG